MTTATNAKATEITDFKAQYEETTDAAGATLYVPAAKDLAEKVLSTFDQVLTPKAELNLKNSIKDAAAAGDFDLLEELMAKRKEIKANESKHANVLKEIRKHEFTDVLKAFRGEFDAIIYEIAYNVLTGSHVAIEKAVANAKPARGSKASAGGEQSTGSRGPNKSYVWELTKPDGSKIHFPIVMGKTGNVDYKKAEAGYKALGYEVKKEEGSNEYFVEPSTIKLTTGGEVPVSRTNLIEAIQKQTGADYQGWKAEKVEAN
ncbi:MULTISPECIES: hypothetical protein [Pseudomonas]|uniref:hypothetical protein n=1 Tax=Pseudomonas TaxID=286 RepID=UPI000760E6A1|nr:MULTISPECIES: hypothetical protein [Pseudomonas]EKV1241274.1 hypothetical protein [Pseudomonas aeruginosa]EKV8586183.1 hypothetical protein [Pseudomonas aeruginosa]ELN5407401.1 hypothetical protein [Pseudomonas aeruginosa]ELP1438592.1 hypothetical protein [Pseudomonas aeruginosa]THB16450.1 hypothetical protein E6W26_29065 [Pseudomonas aeruginosa]